MTEPASGDFDPRAPLRFVVNAAAGREQAAAKREAIVAALREAGHRGADIAIVPPREVEAAARRAAERAAADRGAAIAVGGDGTINTVAQAAWEAGCTMGAIAQGTFNYFARSHGLPEDAGAAVRALFDARPQPVQVARVNQRLFLVNAGLGLYPEMLENREAWQARWGRSRAVSLAAAATTLATYRRGLRLTLEHAGSVRRLRTPTLFVGNNRLQLAQVGLPTAPDRGRIAAVVLQPIGPLALLGLMLRGALGRLGDAESVEPLECQRLAVRPAWPLSRAGMKVSIDGEVVRLAPPLVFEVAPRPLQLLKPPGPAA